MDSDRSNELEIVLGNLSRERNLSNMVLRGKCEVTTYNIVYLGKFKTNTQPNSTIVQIYLRGPRKMLNTLE